VGSRLWADLVVTCRPEGRFIVALEVSTVSVNMYNKR